MIEYIVIGRVNDEEELARQLGRFVADELAGEVEGTWGGATPSTSGKPVEGGASLVLVLVLVLVFFRRGSSPGRVLRESDPLQPDGDLARRTGRDALGQLACEACAPAERR